MKVRIKAGLHGFFIDGRKVTLQPGDVAELTVEQYERLGPVRAEIVYKDDPPAKVAPAAPAAAEPEEEDGGEAPEGGRWSELLKLKANRLKEAIDEMESVDDLKGLIAEEESGKNRYGIRTHAQRRIDHLKG